MYSISMQWLIQGGGGRNRRPLKLAYVCCCFPIFFIRMLKNKAQIARESIKLILELPALKWTLDPCRK